MVERLFCLNQIVFLFTRVFINLEFSDWLTKLRKEILQDTLDKIDGDV